MVARPPSSVVLLTARSAYGGLLVGDVQRGVCHAGRGRDGHREETRANMMMSAVRGSASAADILLAPPRTPTTPTGVLRMPDPKKEEGAQEPESQASTGYDRCFFLNPHVP